jgi:hypothetical protein
MRTRHEDTEGHIHISSMRTHTHLDLCGLLEVDVRALDRERDKVAEGVDIHVGYSGGHWVADSKAHGRHLRHALLEAFPDRQMPESSVYM